jgi:sugar lactone lactonase YvrE
VDEDDAVVVADWQNHRIVEWKRDDTSGTVLAGGNGQGNRPDQLNLPTDVILDKVSDSLIICERGNRRVTRWLRQSGNRREETLIDNIECYGLAMDNEGSVYVSDLEKNEVRRYRRGETNGTLVAGGNGRGAGLNQLSDPGYIHIDRDHTIYVSDYGNDRVMKWAKDAKEGIVVAGGRGPGSALTQLSHPHGVLVDATGTVYVVDCLNHRVMRWCREATQGVVVVGGNGLGKVANQLNYPSDLFLDRHGDLYVVDKDNHRVQKFSLGKD